MDFDRWLRWLGLESPQWRWRAYRWQQQWDAWRAQRGRGGPAFRPQPYCDRCRAIVEAGDRVCPYCGARLPSAAARRIERLFALTPPSWHAGTSGLLAANLAVSALVAALFGPLQWLAPGAGVLDAFGALVPPLVRAGRWELLLTYGFLHIGLLHLVLNLLALSQVGPFLEREIGSARFLVVYLLSVVGGGLADVAVRGGLPIRVAGASGALFGLIGFGLALGHLHGGYAGRAQRDFFARWAVYGFVFGLLVGADNVAHAGGFAVGALLGAAVWAERGLRDRTTALWRAAAAVLVLALPLAYTVLLLRPGGG
jgi:rhomboid protease GluP